MSARKRRRAPGSPEQWLESAASDLRLARLASQHRGVRREQICFHAQQAAEKALKAVLLFQEMEFPFTHDLEELLRLAEGRGPEPA
ncbi:MAG: HEPN domain-containing protein [Bryobacteraceae bacterium]